MTNLRKLNPMEPAPYKVRECTTVTDEELERILNEMAIEGWRLESLHFAMREASRRPSMAFLFFVPQKSS